MTKQDAMIEVRILGLTANRTPHGEIRVDYRRDDPRHTPGDEGTAYYAETAEDAYLTARAMASVSHSRGRA